MKKFEKYTQEIANVENFELVVQKQFEQLKTMYNNDFDNWVNFVLFVETLWKSDIVWFPEFSVGEYCGNPTDLVNAAYVAISPDFKLGKDYVSFVKVYRDHKVYGVLINPHTENIKELLEMYKKYPLLDEDLYVYIEKEVKFNDYLGFLWLNFNIEHNERGLFRKCYSDSLFDFIWYFYYEVFLPYSTLVNNFQVEYDELWMKNEFYKVLSESRIKYYEV